MPSLYHIQIIRKRNSWPSQSFVLLILGLVLMLYFSSVISLLFSPHPFHIFHIFSHLFPCPFHISFSYIYDISFPYLFIYLLIIFFTFLLIILFIFLFLIIFIYLFLIFSIFLFLILFIFLEKLLMRAHLLFNGRRDIELPLLQHNIVRLNLLTTTREK